MARSDWSIQFFKWFIATLNERELIHVEKKEKKWKVRRLWQYSETTRTRLLKSETSAKCKIITKRKCPKKCQRKNGAYFGTFRIPGPVFYILNGTKSIIGSLKIMGKCRRYCQHDKTGVLCLFVYIQNDKSIIITVRLTV